MTKASKPPVKPTTPINPPSRLTERPIAMPAIAPTIGLNMSSRLWRKRRLGRSLEIINSNSDQLTKTQTTMAGGIWERSGTSCHRVSPDNRPINSKGRASRNPTAAEIDRTARISVIITAKSINNQSGALTRQKICFPAPDCQFLEQ